jgi:Zn-dependent protease with chaperone function
MKSLIYYKERIYFIISLIVSLFIYGVMFATFGTTSDVLFEIVFLMGFLIFQLIINGFFIGHIKGNAIRLSENQFPDVYNITKDLSEKMGLKKTPNIYIMQSGGVLNAFATKFLGRDFVIIYSEIFELAYEEGEEALSFVIAHELAHIKRRHITWSYLLFPSALIPFLNLAYSRACEYTCDQYAAYYSSKEPLSGLLLLAAGKKLYKQVNVDDLLHYAVKDDGFFVTLSEVLSTHPHLSSRVHHIKNFKSKIAKELEASVNI